MDRRNFLISISTATGIVLLPRWVITCEKESSLNFVNTSRNVTGLTKKDWLLIQYIQNHLFPSGLNSPSAQNILADVYLYTVLSRSDYDVLNKNRIQSGVGRIQQLSYKLYKQSFINLTRQAREDVLRQFENTAKGRVWLTMILEYILEALLTDPVYGGNPNGIGWKWLGHQPGFPRPPANKRYYLL